MLDLQTKGILIKKYYLNNILMKMVSMINEKCTTNKKKITC